MRVGKSEANLDLYGILGISPAATPAHIRATHRKLALQLHPDRGGDEAKLKMVNLAAAILLDPAARSKYDGLRGVHRPAPWPGVARGTSVAPPPVTANDPVVWPTKLWELDDRSKKACVGVAAALVASFVVVLVASVLPGRVPVGGDGWTMPKDPRISSAFARD